MNSIDPTGKYYVNIISSRNEIQIFTLPALKLDSAVSLDPDFQIVKAIWTSHSTTKRRHNAEEADSSSSSVISCLTSSNKIVVVGRSGVLDTLTPKQHLNDIAFFNDSIWGCFDGGIIDISNAAKPIKHKGDMNFIAGSTDLLVGSEKLYKYNKKFTEVFDMEPKHIFDDIVYNEDGFFVISKNKWVDSEGIIKINKYEDYLVVFKTKAIELLNSDYEVVNIIPANVTFEDLWLGGDDLYLVYNLDSRPLLHKINTPLTSADITINIEVAQPEVVMLDANNEVLDELLESVVVKNLSAAEAHKKLNKSLTNDDDKAAIALCSTINQASTISTVIDNLTGGQADKLFRILADEVQSNVLRSTNLSIWIKGILLKNKVTISKDKKIAGLEKTLTDSLGLLPNLLAIKGRLQLLRAQQELRSRNQDEEIDGDADATMNSEAEESVYIANGENDEDDIQDVEDEEEL